MFQEKQQAQCSITLPRFFIIAQTQRGKKLKKDIIGRLSNHMSKLINLAMHSICGSSNSPPPQVSLKSKANHSGPSEEMGTAA